MAQPATSYSCHCYSVIATGNNKGKLRPLKTQTKLTMCVGRMWVFLVLGVLLFVLGLISVAVYLNIDGATSSTEYTEIIPLYVSSAAVLLAGVAVFLLFWKRYRYLVYFTVAVSIAAGLLCGVMAVLSWIHLIRPLQMLISCQYYVSQKLCQCFLPQQQEDRKYDFKAVESCNVVHTLLPQILYILVGLYATVFVLCIVSAGIALLVLRVERLKQRLLAHLSFDDTYAVSIESVEDSSDSEVNELVTPAEDHPGGIKIAAYYNSQPNSSIKCPHVVTKNNTSGCAITSMNGLTIDVPLRSNCDPGKDISTSLKIASVGTRSVFPNLNLSQDIVNGASQMSETPALNEFVKKSLSDHYRITKTPDGDVKNDTKLSKLSDKNFTSNINSTESSVYKNGGSHQRCQLSASQQRSRSCDSLDTSGSSRQDEQEVKADKTEAKEVKNGKLKEHRRHGKRAATVHNLDTDQLLLILNLQMRYLQETEEKQRSVTNNGTTNYSGINSNFSRRALTPQPLSQKQLISQKVRSHTPTPQQTYGRFQEHYRHDFCSEMYQLNKNFRKSDHASIARHASNSANMSRCSSTSSDQCVEDSKSNMDVCRNTRNQVYFEQKAYGLESKALLERVQTTLTEPANNGCKQHQKAADNFHIVTYSDNVLNNTSLAPKSCASVQNYSVSPSPLHRNIQTEFLLQSVSHNNIIDQNLSAQTVPLESSAFHCVDQNNQLPGPSINRDQGNDAITFSKKMGGNDCAEVMICENFKRNLKPFISTDHHDLERAVNSQEVLSHFTPNLLNYQKLGVRELLPPYSCPPSYKEYISSSCSTLMHSSASSNVDDFYNMPHRSPDLESDEEKIKISNHSNIIGDIFYDEADANIYSNADLILSAQLNERDDIDNNVKGQGYRCKGQRNGRSSPSKSKVKQFIVPEDYYTCINKTYKLPNMSYPNDALSNFQISTKNMPTCSSLDQDNRYVKLDQNNLQSPGCNSNKDDVIVPDVIVPDNRYHQYDKVLDMSENMLPQNISNGKSGCSMTICESGRNHLPCNKQSSSRHQPMYPTSNVVVKIQDIISSDNNEEMRAISLVSNNVQNLHVENMSRVPKIRLHGREMIALDDNNVFDDTLNSGSQSSDSCQIQKYSNNYVNSRNNGSDNSYVTMDVSNESEVSSHVTCRVPYEIQLAEDDNFEETGV